MGRDQKTTHRADASALLDDRGYSGALIRGQNPALLFEKAVVDRITESYYWKEQCFGLNTATLCDRAAELSYIGGTYGGMGKPTPFLCLAFKLAQLVPEKEIVLEYLNFDAEGVDVHGNGEGDATEGGDEDVKSEAEEGHNSHSNGQPRKAPQKGEFKYLRALAAFYIRLAWEPVDIYKTLEPLLADYRKLKRRTRDGFALTYVDQFVDDLLTKDRACATSLWKLPSREHLEELDMLEPRVSPLGEEIEELDMDEDVPMQNGEDEEDDIEYTGERNREGRSRSRSTDRYSERRSCRRSRSPISRTRSRTPSSRDRRPRSRSSDYSYRRRSADSSRSRSRRRDSSSNSGRRRSPSEEGERAGDRFRRRRISTRSPDGGDLGRRSRSRSSEH
ncbi:PRP38-domain-containing protein [Delitschia confertaspora ATCC 74209]|uniref:Pre-mRNA-splicing factor 38 n=1 Tax=Delitschia confertaspora ATCC 74209 TaxID=1513339 RepID=A0A9P4MTG5_9PLEO|nr:PRP38-domain-containing protein [Delitschia confertaspora ATCC 74209]